MNIRDSLNGSIYSQGVKVGVEAWLDMGSQEWRDTSDKTRAAAYQAAQVTGWTDDGLTSFMVAEFAPRIDAEWAALTLDTLKDLSKEFPVEVITVREVKEDNPVFKKRGNDETFVLG